MDLDAYWVWVREQNDLRSRLTEVERYDPPIAGRFADGREQPHPWIRVLGAGLDPATEERYYLVQVSGTGASYLKASELDIYPNQSPG